MSVPFVSQLRAKRSPIEIGAAAPGAMTIRVEASDIWETVRVVARPDTAVSEVKDRVVAALFSGQYAEEFVLKLRGWEMLDERCTLAESGVVEGSILLLAYRRRRAVR